VKIGSVTVTVYCSFNSYFPHFITNLCEIRQTNFSFIAVGDLWVSWKAAQSRP